MKRIIVCLTLMFMLVACSNKNEDSSANSDKAEEVNASTQLLKDKTAQINKLEKQNEELQTAVDNLQLDFNYKQEEAVYYKKWIDELIKDYNDTQLKDLATKLWEYDLAINGLTIPANGIMELQEDTIEISLGQRQSAYPILPNEIFMLGQISGNYSDHLTVNSTPSETYGSDGTVVTAVQHKFTDVENGSTISLTVSEELKQRLGLETTQITIKKK
ncbi:hypothetical protein [Planococcus sp. CAU13]|uniref:hypothetical protein n=1 Tax=Planococcus sp. CAU13 TaxID=1541197 RepID=UPI00052FE418|nr:hypothetical protein [Planococcus sp. CAU13]